MLGAAPSAVPMAIPLASQGVLSQGPASSPSASSSSPRRDELSKELSQAARLRAENASLAEELARIEAEASAMENGQNVEELLAPRSVAPTSDMGYQATGPRSDSASPVEMLASQLRAEVEMLWADGRE